MSTWMSMVGRVDERLLHTLAARRPTPVSRGMAVLSRLVDWPAAVGITLALFYVPFDVLLGPALPAIITLTASHLMVQGLKRTAHRKRPNLPRGLSSLVEAPDRFSFPSGHAAAALSIALPVAAVLDGVSAWAVVLLALVIGASRCYVGIHYPGDVLMGWILAAVSYVGGSLLLPVYFEPVPL